MALPEYVVRRGQRLYYRRAYPKELWPVTGNSSSFSMSLRTSDPAEALRLRPAAERRYQAKADAARIKLGQHFSQPPLTRATAEALAVRWYQEALRLMESSRAFLGPDGLRDAKEAAKASLAEGKRVLAERDFDALWSKARKIVANAGYASELEAERHLVLLLARASIAADGVELKRLAGDYGATPADLLFAAATQPQETPAEGSGAEPQGPLRAGLAGSQRTSAGRTVADLERVFREERLPQLAPGSRLGYEPVFRLLADVLGCGARLADLTHEDGQRLFRAVQGIPANARKSPKLKGLGLAEQIATAKRLGLPTLSPKTINEGYMGRFGTLFGFAERRGWMKRNPVAGLRVREDVAPRDKRDPFGPQLKIIFGAAPWGTADRTGGGSPLHYWGPLLALYHGLRLAEVVGLQVQDVGEEGGQPVLLIRPGVRKLKSKAAERVSHYIPS